MKFKLFSYPEDPTGGIGGAQPTVDPPIDTGVQPDGGQTGDGGVQSLLNVPSSDTPPAEPPIDNPSDPDTPPAEPKELVDYGFSEYETYQDNQEYFGELQKTFTDLGITPEQSPQLVELAERLIGPMKEHYDGLLAEFSPEKIGERIDAEFASMTPEERANMDDLKVILERDLTPEEYNSFSGLLHTKADVAMMVKLIKANTSGPSQFRQGSNTGSAESTITLDQYRNEFDRIMDNYNGEESEKALQKLRERASQSGDDQVKELIKM